MKTRILCEDRYGIGFFQDLIARLKTEGLIPALPVSVSRFYGACNTKTEREINVLTKLNDIDSFVIVFDCDGSTHAVIEPKITRHIPTNQQRSTKVILLDYEIEDWLFINSGYSWTLVSRNHKPSEILREREGYEKYRLRQYVPRLDIALLRQNCQSFKDFVEFWQVPPNTNAR
jgi:hypothetical protein